MAVQMGESPNLLASRVGGESLWSHVSVNAGTEPKYLETGDLDNDASSYVNVSPCLTELICDSERNGTNSSYSYCVNHLVTERIISVNVHRRYQTIVFYFPFLPTSLVLCPFLRYLISPPHYYHYYLTTCHPRLPLRENIVTRFFTNIFPAINIPLASWHCGGTTVAIIERALLGLFQESNMPKSREERTWPEAQGREA